MRVAEACACGRKSVTARVGTGCWREGSSRAAAAAAAGAPEILSASLKIFDSENLQQRELSGRLRELNTSARFGRANFVCACRAQAFPIACETCSCDELPPALSAT